MARRAAIVLTPRLPWPLDDGGRIVMWQSVWAASREYDVTLLSFVPPGTERDPIPSELSELGIAVGRVPHRPPSPAFAAATGLLGRWPYTIRRYRDRAFARMLRERVAVLSPAYVLANHLHMAPYGADLDGLPLVLREHNVEHLWMERYARARGAAPAGLYARAQAGRLRRVERALVDRAELTLAIQERESEALRALAPRARVETLPVGVDMSRFPSRAPAEPPVVLLGGSFAWAPNVDGALRFLREGWPLLRSGLGEARLRLAGKHPPRALLHAAARAGAEIEPDVRSMPDEFARATLLVIPLWIGAGARVRIVEALAAGLPVVSTPLGAEGLELEPGVHFAEADTAAALAEAIVGLLRDRPRMEGLGRAGRAFAERSWALPTVARRQNDLVAQVVG